MRRHFAAPTLGALLFACLPAIAAAPIPADHPEGVWGIPPIMAGAMASQAIGDSDRMTLKFRKR